MKAKHAKKEVKTVRHHSAKAHHPKTKSRSVSVGFVGFVLAVAAAAISYFATRHANAGEFTLARGAGLFLGTLILRVLFLKLSARMLSLKSATWGHTMAVVGANAVFLTALTFIGSLAGLSGMYFMAGLIVLEVFFALLVAREALHIKLLDAIALYALSLAFVVVAFAIMALVFHPELTSLLGGI